MRLRNSLLLFFTAVLLLPYPTCAQSSPQTLGSTRGATIRGTVYDPDGRAVPDAAVTLLGSLIAVAETRTDSHGEYRFDGLAGGTYAVVANLPGFTNVSTEIKIAGNETSTDDVRLKLSAVQEQVVVSASLGGALAPEVGSSVTVVSHDEIEDQGVETVADALRNSPGVAINRTGQQGAVTSAFIRGGNSNYDLVMIDGIPMNDFGGAFDMAPLPTEGVDQVEVLRGPQSALYGSNAVAGAINIVSDQGEGTPHFSFSGEGGSYDYYRLTTGGAGLTHGFGWSYNFSRISTNGPVIDDSYWNDTSFISLSYSRSPRRKIIAHFLGDAGSDLNPGPWGSNPDGLYPGLGSPFATSFQDQNVFGYQVSETEHVSSSFTQVSTVSVVTDRFFFPSSVFGNSFTDNLRLVANTRSEITISPKDVFVAGFEYDRETFKNSFVTNADDTPFTLPRNSYAFFAENRWNPGNRWFISTGVRVDVIDTGSLAADEVDAARPFLPAASVTKVNPRLSAAFLAHQSDDGFFGITRLHSSVGTGIRPPDGFELGFTNNPDLKPERSISIDAGSEQRFAHDRAVLDVTYFYNGYRDQIVSTGDFPDLSTFMTANLAKSRAYGIESSLRLRPLRSLEIMGEYTWLNTAILALAGTTEVQFPFVVGQPLLRRPRSSGGYNITWTRGPLMLNSNASIRGPVLDDEPNEGISPCEADPPLPCLFRNSGYVDANAGFAYHFPHGIEIYGRLNNFLNQSYEESFGFPALKLNFVAGIKLELPTGRNRSSP
jgi:outer membrane receptor protein involved in Fe transport